MPIGSFFYRQLGHPTGSFGRGLLRFLNWANAPMIGLALTCLDATPDDRVLEIGFGGGHLIGQLVERTLPEQVVGLERSAEAMAMCGVRYRRLIAQGRVNLQTSDVDGLPFDAGVFNKVCSVNALYFWPDPVTVLAECRRVLAPGGQFYLCYNTKDLLDLWGFTRIGLRGYSVVEIEGMMGKAGFSGVTTASARSLRNGTFYCSFGMVS